MNLDVDIAAVSAVASSLRYSHIPTVDDCRRAASAGRIEQKAVAVVRGAPRGVLDHWYRGRLRARCPADARLGPSHVVHTVLSVNSSLPSSTPSSARLPRRVPQPVALWVRPASFFTATPAAPGSLLAPVAVADAAMSAAATFPVPPPPPPQMVLCKFTHHPLMLCLQQRLILLV